MKKQRDGFFKQAIKDYRFWIKIILGLSQILSVFIFITIAYIRNAKLASQQKVLLSGYYAIFVNLSFFTTLSNLFSGYFFLHSDLYHYDEGKSKFNNDHIAKAVTVYITLTLIIYNISQWAEAHPYNFTFSIDYLSFISEHFFGPLIVIFYYIFLYNHKNTSTMKDFSQKYLWLIVVGLVSYGIFFWVLGMLSKYGGGLGFYYWNGSKEFGAGSHFVYPFLDFNHVPYFFTKISAAAESTIMLFFTLLVAVIFAYFYTYLANLIKNKNWQEKFI